MQERSALFKNRGAFRPDDIRRRREEQTVELRRQTRVESMAKRRNISQSTIDLAAYSAGSGDAFASGQAASDAVTVTSPGGTTTVMSGGSLVALGDAAAVTSSLIANLPAQNAEPEVVRPEPFFSFLFLFTSTPPTYTCTKHSSSVTAAHSLRCKLFPL